jgi:uncharacterized protein (TIGR02996 family)
VRNPALEAAILARPDDESAHLVYADWLTEHGDLLGEWISRACRGESFEFLNAHEAELFGPVAGSLGYLVSLGWARGFLRNVTVSLPAEGEGACEEAVGQLLEAPVARFLRQLVVDIVRRPGNRYDRVAEMIARAAPPALEWLELGDFDDQDAQCDVSALWPGVRRLQHLSLRADSIGIEGIDLPELRELRITTTALTTPPLAAIARAAWPNLELLSLWTGSRDDGARYEWKDLEPIADGRVFPRLVHLALRGFELADEIVVALASSPVLPHLRSIDLSQGGLTDRGANVMAAGGFQHLEEIRVKRCMLTDEGVEALRSVCPRVLSAGQREPAE